MTGFGSASDKHRRSARKARTTRYRGHWLPGVTIRGRLVQVCLWEPPYWHRPLRTVYPKWADGHRVLFDWFAFGPVEVRLWRPVR